MYKTEKHVFSHTTTDRQRITMADFLTSLPYVLKNEGGYVNDPNDKGGITNYGITATTAAQYGYTGDMHSIPTATVQTIWRAFWDGGGLDGCTDQNVATALLDASADGWGNAATVIQTALAACGWQGDQDGKMGPDTLAGVNATDPNTFLQALSQAWLNWYAGIVANDASQQGFLAGWNNRANRLLTLQDGVAGYIAEVTTNPGASAVIALGILACLLMFFGNRG
jgi:type VI secretion system secreted protein VgrG